MPELPEVEVVKIFLEDKLLNKTISTIQILNSKSFIGDPNDVLNKKIIKFGRVGKQLSIHLSSGKIMLAHLKMTGQLILGDTMLGHPTKFEKYPNKSTRLIIGFASPVKGRCPKDGGVLFFNDQRKFGWIKVYNNNAELADAQSKLGLDILDNKFTPDYLYTQLQRSSRPVKLVLLDQNFFAGIGNIYANDALFLSKIHPSIPAHNITKIQSQKIHQNIITIMQQSILAGGSTMKDKNYVRPDGSYGNNQFYFRVYQRAGEPCLVCQTKIIRITLGGRGTFLCPHCQSSL